MKTIRNIAIVAGVSLALFALGSTEARCQAITSTSFAGTFTLPVETHWGAITLPAGDYHLRYGSAFSSSYLVTVADKTEQRVLGMFLAGSRNDVKAAENGLNCIREGDMLYVRALEMPAIGESVHFKIPHGVEVRSTVGPIENARNQGGKNHFVQVAIRIDRAPVK